MVFRCWLCPSEFEMKKYLQVHLCNAPHRRLRVVCPFCQAARFTTHSMQMLKSHFKKFHRQPVDEFPKDFFTEATGYFLAMYPRDYKWVLTPAKASSPAAKFCMKLIRNYHTATQNSLKSMEEWEKQWATAQDEPEPVVDYFDSIGSSLANGISESVQLSDREKDNAGETHHRDSSKEKHTDLPPATSGHSDKGVEKTSFRQSKTTSIKQRRTSPRGTSPRGASPRGSDKDSLKISEQESFRIKKSKSTNPLRMSLRKVKKPTSKYDDTARTVPPLERMVLRNTKATVSVSEQESSSNSTEQQVIPTPAPSVSKSSTDITLPETFNNKAIVVLEPVNANTRTMITASHADTFSCNVSKPNVITEQRPPQSPISIDLTREDTIQENNQNSTGCDEKAYVPIDISKHIAVSKTQTNNDTNTPTSAKTGLPKDVARKDFSREHTVTGKNLGETLGGVESEGAKRNIQISASRFDTEDVNIPIDLSIKKRITTRTNAKLSTNGEHKPTRNDGSKNEITERAAIQNTKQYSVSIANTMSMNTPTNSGSTFSGATRDTAQRSVNRKQTSSLNTDIAVSNTMTTPVTIPNMEGASTGAYQKKTVDNERRRENGNTTESTFYTSQRRHGSASDVKEKNPSNKTDTASSVNIQKQDVRKADSVKERESTRNKITINVNANKAPVRKYSIVVGRPVCKANATSIQPSEKSENKPTGNSQKASAPKEHVAIINNTQSHVSIIETPTRNNLTDATKNDKLKTSLGTNQSQMQTNQTHATGKDGKPNTNDIQSSTSKTGAPTIDTEIQEVSMPDVPTTVSPPTTVASTEPALTIKSTESTLSRESTPTRGRSKRGVNTDHVSTRSNTRKSSSRENTPVRSNQKVSSSTERVETRHKTKSPASCEQVPLRSTRSSNTSTNHLSSLKEMHNYAAKTDENAMRSSEQYFITEQVPPRTNLDTVAGSTRKLSSTQNSEAPINHGQTKTIDSTKVNIAGKGMTGSISKEQQLSKSKTQKPLTSFEKATSNICKTSTSIKKEVTETTTGNIPITVEEVFSKSSSDVDNRTNSRKNFSVNISKPTNTSENTSPKKNSKTVLIPEVPPDILGEIYEHLGTRSWTAKASQSQAQQESDALSTTSATSTTSTTSPTRTAMTQGVGNVAVPSTVLTPPGTPTSLVATAASASTTFSASNKRSCDDDDTIDASTSAKVAKLTFSCMTCSRTFNSSSSLRIHKRLHSAQRGFTCPRCKKRFLYLSSYSVHLINAHGTSALSSAPIDDSNTSLSDGTSVYNFESDDSSAETTLVDTTREASACITSMPRYSSAMGLRTSTNMSSATTSTSVSSALRNATNDALAVTASNSVSFSLGKSTSRSSAITSNSEFHAPNNESQTLETSEDVEHAQETDEVDSEPVLTAEHKCNICQGSFPSYGQLKEHRAMHQLSAFSSIYTPGHKRYKCDKCSQSFSQRRMLESHKVVHSKVAFPCPLCHKRFWRISSVKCHTYQAHRKTLETLAAEGVEKAKLLMNVKVRVPRPAMCETCGSRFETYERMEAHQKFHINGKDKERPRYSCTQCKAVFGAEWLLGNHIRTVHRDRSQKSITQAAITWKKPRDRHGRFLPENPLDPPLSAFVKEKEKDNEPYSCDFCGNRFTQRRKLTRHIRTHLNGGLVTRNTSIIAKPAPKRETFKPKKTGSSAMVPNKIPYRNRYGYGKMGLQNHEVDSEWLAERVKSNETGNVSYRCKVCKVGFSHQSHLMVHINEWVDHHCKNYSKKLSDVIYASFSPEQKKKYNPCDVCGLFYGCKSSLYRHHQIAHGKLISVSNGKTLYAQNLSPSSDTDVPNTLRRSGTREQRDDEQPPVLVSQSLVYDNPDIEIVTEETDEDFLTQYQNDIYSETGNGNDNSELISTTTSDVPDVQSTVSNIRVVNVVSQATGERATVQGVQENTRQLDNMETSSSITTMTSPTSMNTADVGTVASGGNGLNVNRNTLTVRPIPILPKEEFIDPLAERDNTVTLDPASITAQVQESMNFEIKSDSNENFPIASTDITLADLTTNTSVASVSNTVTKSKSSINPGDEFIQRIDTINDDATFDDSDSNDVNSSDEENIFDGITTNEEQEQTMPVGENPECIQCQSPFIPGQSAITCHLCCKRFCLPCSKVSRTVYKKAFLRGRSAGLLWMCPVCKPAFPNFMVLLRQLAEFEDALNNRMKGVAQRISDAEQKVEAARGKGCSK